MYTSLIVLVFFLYKSDDEDDDEGEDEGEEGETVKRKLQQT